MGFTPAPHKAWLSSTSEGCSTVKESREFLSVMFVSLKGPVSVHILAVGPLSSHGPHNAYHHVRLMQKQHTTATSWQTKPWTKEKISKQNGGAEKTAKAIAKQQEELRSKERQESEVDMRWNQELAYYINPLR